MFKFTSILFIFLLFFPDFLLSQTINPPFKKIVGSFNYFCGIDDRDTAVCWGQNFNNRFNIPATSKVKDLSVINALVCGRLMDDSVKCWGSKSYSSSKSNVSDFKKYYPPPGLKISSKIWEIQSTLCAIDLNQKLTCWGGAPWHSIPRFLATNLSKKESDRVSKEKISNSESMVFTPNFLKDSKIKSFHYLYDDIACAIDLSNKVHCVGAKDKIVQRRFPPNYHAKSLHFSLFETCAIEIDDTLKCWGEKGQSVFDIPRDFKAVYLEGFYSDVCAIDHTNQVRCFGSNTDGRKHPPADLKAKSVAVGAHHACALKLDGTVICWGGKNLGSSKSPKGMVVEKVVAGRHHACALKKDRSVVCWGSDNFSQLKIPDNLRATDIEASDDKTCALKTDHTTICWGNIAGRLNVFASEIKIKKMISTKPTYFNCGITTEDKFKCWDMLQNHKIAITPDTIKLKSISVTPRYICGLNLKNNVICWDIPYESIDSGSWEPAGKIPDGKIITQSIPLKKDIYVTPKPKGDFWEKIQKRFGTYKKPSPVKQTVIEQKPFEIAVSNWRAKRVVSLYNAACAIKEDDTVICWGKNEFEQLDVPKGLKAKHLFDSTDVCAIKLDNRLQCWGRIDKNHIRPPNGIKIKDLYYNSKNACAIKTDGTPVCWGNIDKKYPSAPQGIKVKSLAVGGNFVCGIQLDDTLHCWWDNKKQLGYKYQKRPDYIQTY